MSSTKKNYDFKFNVEKPEVIVYTNRTITIKEAPAVFAPSRTNMPSQVSENVGVKSTSNSKFIKS